VAIAAPSPARGTVPQRAKQAVVAGQAAQAQQVRVRAVLAVVGVAVPEVVAAAAKHPCPL